MDVEEFYREFIQEILADSDVDKQFTEDVFFQKACNLLEEAGEIDTADRAQYRFPTKGIQVDGYGGDPADTVESTRSPMTLNLIILDFNSTPEKIDRLTKTEMDTAFRRLSNYLKHALEKRWRDSLEETNPAFQLADLIARRWKNIVKIRLLLVSNRELSERIDGRPTADIEDKQITYSVWDIHRLHRQATVGAVQEDIEVNLVKDFGGGLPVLPAQQSEADHESYLTVIPGQTLAEIYDRWGARLLEQNVRVFLQARGKVNRGIRKTLETEPSMFFAYNNGITATAEQVDITNEGNQLLLRSLRNFQIVNGGQTTASIHVSKLNKIDISQTFIQMKLSVVTPEKASELVPKISEYANSQNRVNAADFFANHPFHVRIENFSRRIHAPSPDGTFRQSKWFYERARGQYADARANLTHSQRKKFDLEYPKRQLFTKTDLAKFLNVWEGNPHEVSQGAQKNFALFAKRIGQAWEKSPDDFNESWYRTAIAKAIIFKSTERIVTEQSWYQGGYRANIVAYAIAKVAYDVESQSRAVDFDSIWRQQSQQGVNLDKAVAIAAKKAHDILIDPHTGISNVTEWAKKQACWGRVQNLNIDWPDTFWKRLISKQEQKEIARTARREQRELNGIEAQTVVVSAGGSFWNDALSWGEKQHLLTTKETEILRVCASIPSKIPTEKQALKAIMILAKLNSEGYPAKLDWRK